MDIKLFDYNLPANYIAQEPLAVRDKSKLMVLERISGRIQHVRFHQLVDFLEPGDLLVLNNSKVIPVRLYGTKKNTGGKIEALLIKPLSDMQWMALLKPGRRIHEGNRIIFSPQLEGEVIGKDEKEGVYLINMHAEGDFHSILRKTGKIPTPPYIKKELIKSSFYQTIFASLEGSIAAPTAGFHFTHSLLKAIENKGIKIIYLTLHIGRGTFEKIKVDQVEDHKMKSELFIITSENARIINQAIKKNSRIIGVGTSVTRALESAVHQQQVKEGTCRTDLFIYPGYQFRVIKALITNFHLPRSTPLMLASAFAGKDFLLHAYQDAIHNQYRFYSFGDAMFII